MSALNSYRRSRRAGIRKVSCHCLRRGTSSHLVWSPSGQVRSTSVLHVLAFGFFPRALSPSGWYPLQEHSLHHHAMDAGNVTIQSVRSMSVQPLITCHSANGGATDLTAYSRRARRHLHGRCAEQPGLKSSKINNPSQNWFVDNSPWGVLVKVTP